MKVCIYGAGSLGTVLGAYVAKSGEEIDLVNRNKAHVAALKEHGATITGKANFNVKVNAMLPEEMKEKYVRKCRLLPCRHKNQLRCKPRRKI